MKTIYNILCLWILLFCCPFIITSTQAQLKSPSDFLGYELGERFTPHYKIMDYVDHVAKNSNRVVTHNYGHTYGKRVLKLVFISSENHIKNINTLQEIHLNTLKNTSKTDNQGSTNQPAIVWLSYNVHGNETSSSEAAIKTLYELVQNNTANTYQKWLDNVLIIMDPMLNPDGRDRYVNWYHQTVGHKYNPSADAREHYEPWPGGRTNHYYFDLNRDWAWQTQIETQQRKQHYYQWLPQIHVDYHEQSYKSPYYFAPAAEPYHPAITSWQRNFQDVIGKNHAQYFDKNHWLYFTREIFDLYYPSYGDTWPIFHGAIGMTYEQAGHGFAGLGIKKPEGDILTLYDRIEHHYTTGISTIETASNHHNELTQQQRNYFHNVIKNGAGKYASYVISHQKNSKAKIKQALMYLDKANITYQLSQKNQRHQAYSYQNQTTKRFQIQENDIVISTKQLHGTMVRVLFEPKTELSTPITYDITAWPFHYVWGLEGYAVEKDINTKPYVEKIQPVSIQNAYAYILEWDSFTSAKVLSHLLTHDVQTYFTEKDITIDNKTFKKGSIIIINNEHQPKKLPELLNTISKNHAASFHAISHSYVQKGPNFGSSSVKYLKAPKIMVLSGEGSSSYSVGEVWHLFEQQLDYPATLVNLNQFNGIELHKYDVMVFPSGYWHSRFDNAQLKKLSAWIRNGGVVVSLGNANRMFANNDTYTLNYKDHEEDDTEKDTKLINYEDAELIAAEKNNPGAIFKVSMDYSHPLAFGYNETYYSLKLNATMYAYLKKGWNVGTIAPEHTQPVSGYSGKKVTENGAETLVYGVENMGQGKVVYMIDNVLFRSFWQNGKQLFANSIFFVPNY